MLEQAVDLNRELTPIEKLMQAVLLLSVRDYCNGRVSCRIAESNNNAVKNNYYQAETWFRSNNTSHTFSFLNICHHFGYNSETIRRELKHARARNKKALFCQEGGK